MKFIAGHKVFGTYDINTVFPLYLYPDEQSLDQTRRVNFDPKSHKAIVAAVVGGGASVKHALPQAPPRLPRERAPTIPRDGAIPPEPEPLPDTMTYDATKQRLHIGKGFVDNVSPAMWDYEVSGKNVLRQWFSYRKRDRTRPQIGDKRAPSPLTLIQPAGWLAEYTTDLLDLLNVLGRLVDLEPRQADVLSRICEGPLLSHQWLLDAGVIKPDPDANVAEAEDES